MRRSRIRASFAAAAVALCPVALHGGANQWTSQGPDVPIRQLASDPADPETVYASEWLFDSGGIFKTSDGGNSWKKLEIPGFPFLPFDAVTGVAVDPTRPRTVYAVTLSGQFLRSHDGGTSWEAVLVGPSQPSSIAVDAGTGAIYVGTGDYINPASVPVRRSTDGGGSWSAAGLPGPRATYTLLADSMDQTVFAGTDWAYQDLGYYGYTAYGGAVARTTDGGATWALSAKDLGSSVAALARDADGSSLYAGTAEGVVYRSVDRGVDWTLMSKFSPSSILSLVADPAAPGALYAGTTRGVFRSSDRGASWTSFNVGMGPRDVRSLTIDSTGTILHAGTANGVFDIAIENPHPLDPCAPAPDHLCLLGGRFQVELNAVEPFTNTGTAARSVPIDDRNGYFSLPALTGDPTLPEVLVKMVDATSLPGGADLFFYGSMTSVAYTLTITDTTTGQSREYGSDSLCGGADALGSVASGAWDYAEHPLGMPAAPLQSSGPELALLSGRFRVSLTARNPATGTETAGAAIAQADRFGYFSLPAFTGDPRLPEVFVKMIEWTDGNVLFFHAPLTSLPYTLTIVDSVSGRERTYVNDPDRLDRICGGDDVMVLPK